MIGTLILTFEGASNQAHPEADDSRVLWVRDKPDFAGNYGGIKRVIGHGVRVGVSRKNLEKKWRELITTLFFFNFFCKRLCESKWFKKIKEWSIEEDKDSKKNMRNKPKKETLFFGYITEHVSLIALFPWVRKNGPKYKKRPRRKKENLDPFFLVVFAKGKRRSFEDEREKEPTPPRKKEIKNERER